MYSLYTRIVQYRTVSKNPVTPKAFQSRVQYVQVNCELSKLHTLRVF